VVGLAGFGALGFSRVRIVEDITALLPGDQEQGSLIELARRAGLMRRVAVVIGPDDPGSDRLLGAAAGVADALGSLEGIESVTGSVDQEQARRAAQVIFERAPALYRPERDTRSPQEIRAGLEDLKQRLAAPEALVMQPYLLADPLGFSREALAGLEAAGQAMGATIERGRVLSADRRYALVFATIDCDPMDGGRAEAFTARLDQAVAAALEKAGARELQVAAIGGAHYAAASAGVIMGDVRLALILTAGGLLLIFALFFRRLVIVPAALLPGGIGIAVALGVLGLAGSELHALTIGFAAAITGISVDYAIHLLHRSLHHARGDSRERITFGLGAVARPLVLGATTTVAAFLIVATSGFPGMRQLAVFSAISIPTALAATLFVLPALHRLLLGTAVPKVAPLGRLAGWLASPGPAAPGRRVVTVVLFAGLLIGGGLGVWRVGLSGDPRDLGSVDPDLAQREALLREVFPGLADQALIVSTGSDRDRALLANDQLYEALLEAGVERSELVSISPFLPAAETQARGLAAARELYGNGPRSARKAFADAGFAGSYFEGLAAGIDPAALVPKDYADTGLSGLLAETVHEEAGRHHVLTRVRAPDDPALDALARVADRVDGARLISERLEARQSLERLQAELVRMLGIWLGLALLGLAIVQRSVFFGLRAALPAVIGVATAAGAFGLLDRPLTTVAAAGLTLVMGLGIDYGIFMQLGDRAARKEAAPAVLASAFTTLAAFGVLAAAQTRAMADLGLIILVGVAAAALAALALLPAITRGGNTTGGAR